MPKRDSFFVSVVITCYNQARFLGEAIESVLAQSYRHFEIIIVDDGSEDDTAAVTARYPEARYIRQKNQGVVAARNAGLRESKGDYVVFLDGDDRLIHNALETQLSYLKARPECAFVCGLNSFITEHGLTLADWTPVPSVESEHYLALLRDNFIMMPAMVMYRRAVLESLGGFSPSADHSSDYDLYLRIARSFPVYCHDGVVAEYRVHGANTSHKSAVMLRSTMKVYLPQWKYVKGNKRYEEVFKRGARTWRERYGEELVGKMQTDVRREGFNKWTQLIQDALVLLWYSPRVFARHVRRKITVTIFGKGHTS